MQTSLMRAQSSKQSNPTAKARSRRSTVFISRYLKSRTIISEISF